MSEPAADVSVTVEYTMDKWVMDRVPWALWFCLAGLAVSQSALCVVSWLDGLAFLK